MAVRKKKEMMMWSCCASWNGVVHLVTGLGVGFLLVHYFALTDLLLWGWVLVGLGVLGHLFLWKNM